MLQGPALCVGSSLAHFDDIKPGNLFEVAHVRRRDTPAEADRRRRHESVVAPHVPASRDQVGPDSCVSPGGEEIEVEGGNDRKNRLNEGLAAGTMLGACPMHAVEQLAGGYRRDRHLIVLPEMLHKMFADRARRACSPSPPPAPLEIDEDRRVYDRSHGSPGSPPPPASTASMSLTKSGSGAGAPASAAATSRTGRPRRRVPTPASSSGWTIAKTGRSRFSTTTCS